MIKILIKSYKIEINPTEKQKRKINQTIGVCRFIYNFFVAKNKELYENKEKYMTGIDFSKWLNNEFIPNNNEYL
jgi:putative transposase